MHNPAIPIVVGALLLFFGRKLFWLFVAAAGFLIGAQLTPILLPHQPQIAVFAVALLLGIAGAIIAIFFQEVAIAIAGFLAGANFSALVVHDLFAGPGAGSFLWLVVAIGGILGAFLMVAFFDWMLILFSSLEGARFIVSVFHLPQLAPGLLFVILALLGIVVQAAMLQSTRSRPLPP